MHSAMNEPIKISTNTIKKNRVIIMCIFAFDNNWDNTSLQIWLRHLVTNILPVILFVTSKSRKLRLGLQYWN